MLRWLCPLLPHGFLKGFRTWPGSAAPPGICIYELPSDMVAQPKPAPVPVARAEAGAGAAALGARQQRQGREAGRQRRGALGARVSPMRVMRAEMGGGV